MEEGDPTGADRIAGLAYAATKKLPQTRWKVRTDPQGCSLTQHLHTHTTQTHHEHRLHTQKCLLDKTARLKVLNHSNLCEQLIVLSISVLHTGMDEVELSWLPILASGNWWFKQGSKQNRSHSSGSQRADFPFPSVFPRRLSQLWPDRLALSGWTGSSQRG